MLASMVQTGPTGHKADVSSAQLLARDERNTYPRIATLSLTVDDLELHAAIDGIAFVVGAGADDVLAISDPARAEPCVERAHLGLE